MGVLRDSWHGARLPSATLLLFLLVLLAVGALFVHSAVAGGREPFPGSLAQKHMFRIGIGLSFLALFLVVDYRRLKDFSPLLYLIGIGVLLGQFGQKLLFGGVVRWIDLPGFSFQPSEVVKLFTVLMVARLLIPGGKPPRGWEHALPLAVTAVPCLLVAVQPDLGTALVLPPTLLAMLWVSGVSTRRLLAYVGTALALVPLGLLFLRDYQLARLRVFLNPLLGPASGASGIEGYQAHQALIAIGSGGPTGKGLFMGSQNYLGYLPENHNDFIFAVLGEEWGLLGTLCLTFIFLCLFLSCLGIAYRTREPFGRLVVVGITVMLAFQTWVNLAMSVGLAPVVGLPLPFMSFGGSSLLTSLASMGIVLGIGMRPVRIVFPDGLQPGASPIVPRPVRHL
ncbi:MAG: FtsW/RodA/SpoVE family cell cycle protein [Planctomycetota bacterium]